MDDSWWYGAAHVFSPILMGAIFFILSLKFRRDYPVGKFFKLYFIAFFIFYIVNFMIVIGSSFDPYIYFGNVIKAKLVRLICFEFISYILTLPFVFALYYLKIIAPPRPLLFLCPAVWSSLLLYISFFYYAS